MVFRQVGNDTDNLISKFGLLNKSFLDIKRDFQNGQGIRSFGNVVKKEDIDNLKKFSNELKNGVSYSQAYKNNLSNSHTYIKKQGVAIGELYRQQSNLNKQLKAGKITQQEYNTQIAANKLQIQNLVNETNNFTFAQKAATIATKAFGIIAETALNIGIALAINLIITQVTKLVNIQKELKQSVENVNSTYDDLKSKTDSMAQSSEELISKYEKLSKGVDNLGKNVSLTTDEYKDYQNVCNQIAEDIPSLIQGYDSQGNAILNLKGNVDQLKQSYIEVRKEAYATALVENKEDNQNALTKLYGHYNKDYAESAWTYLRNDEQRINLLKEVLTKSRADIITELENGADYGYGGTHAAKAYLKYLGFDSDMTEQEFDNFRDKLETELQKLDNAKTASVSAVKNIIQEHLFSDADYYQIDSQMQELASILVLNLQDDTLKGLTNEDAVIGYVNDLLDKLKSASPEIQTAYKEIFNFDVTDLKISDGSKVQQQIDRYIQTLADYLGMGSSQLKISLGFDLNYDDLNEKLKAAINGVTEKFAGRNKLSFDEILSIAEDDLGINTEDEIIIFNKCVQAADSLTQAIELYKIETNSASESTSISTRSLEELKEAYDKLSDSIGDFTKNQKTLNSAIKEIEEHGELSASTIRSLIDAGYANALVMNKETGAVTLNVNAYEKLNKKKKESIILEAEQQKSELEKKFNDEQKAIYRLAEEMRDANAARREAIALEMKEHGLTMSDIQSEIDAIKGMTASLNAPEWESGSSNSNSSNNDKPQSVLDFEKALSDKQHALKMGQIAEADYYDWLEKAAEKAYKGLADYQDDWRKHQEDIYDWKKKQEQNLFDQNIENLNKEKEKALDNNDFNSAKASVNTQITETQKHIVELKTSGKKDVDDEIKELENNLEELKDTLNDITSEEYEFNISIKEYGINDLNKEFEKTGDTSVYDKQASIYASLINDTQNEISRLLDLGYSKESDEIRKLTDRIDEYSENIADIWEKQTDVITDNVDEQIKALDRSIDNTGDTSLYSEKVKVYKDGQQQILDMIEFYRQQGYSEDSEIIKNLKEQWNEYGDNIKDTLQEQADEQVEIYNEILDKQISLLEKQKDEQNEYYDQEIKALEDKKKALEDVNEEIEKENSLEEKRLAIAEAERNLYKNVRLTYAGNGQWVQKAREEDLQAVKEAENDLSNALKEQEIEAIEKQITALEEAKDSFDNSIDKQIKAIEESQKSFEEAMKESYEVRKQLDKAFITSIVGEDKAKEYIAAVDSDNKDKKLDNSNNKGSADNLNKLMHTAYKLYDVKKIKVFRMMNLLITYGAILCRHFQKWLCLKI